MNPICIARIKEMIDAVAAAGFEGYFIDEPNPMKQCFCPSCRAKFDAWYQADLAAAPHEVQEEFRSRCVIEYIAHIANYCKQNHSQLMTSACVMDCFRSMWPAAAGIASLDSLGTDLYWANNDRDVEEMCPLLDELAGLCRRHGKIHHEWLQCWDVRAGTEDRIFQQGRILVRERPDMLYVWAWQGQVGTNESCDNPSLAWAKACEILKMAKDIC